jgi:hypothetical protein
MHERDNILEALQLVFSDGRMLMSFPRNEFAGQATAHNPGIASRAISSIKLRFNDGECFGNPNKADAFERSS